MRKRKNKIARYVIHKLKLRIPEQNSGSFRRQTTASTCSQSASPTPVHLCCFGIRHHLVFSYSCGSIYIEFRADLGAIRKRQVPIFPNTPTTRDRRNRDEGLESWREDRPNEINGERIGEVVSYLGNVTPTVGRGLWKVLRNTENYLKWGFAS